MIVPRYARFVDDASRAHARYNLYEVSALFTALISDLCIFVFLPTLEMNNFPVLDMKRPRYIP